MAILPESLKEHFAIDLKVEGPPPRVRQELPQVDFLSERGGQLTNITAIIRMIDWQEFVVNMRHAHKVISAHGLERVMHFLNVGDLSRVFRTKAKQGQQNHSL